MAFPWGAALAVGAVAIIGLFALRRPLLALLGVRHAFRRPKHLTIVAIGLMAATAILTGANVAGDSFLSSAEDGVRERLGGTDVVVSSHAPFPLADWEPILTYHSVVARNDGHTLALQYRASVGSERTGLGEPSVRLMGIDPAGFGSIADLRAKAGTVPASSAEWDDGSAVINQALAEKIDAIAGDRLTLFLLDAPDGGAREVEYRIVAIVADHGSDPLDGGPVVLVDRSPLAALVGPPGERANLLLLSATRSADSDRLTAAVRSALLPEEDEEPFRVLDIRGEAMRGAQGEGFLRFMFLALGSFSIIAGLFLIVSLMAMLIDERKADLATLRATGTLRSEVTQLQLHEGLVYALGGMILGIIGGIGLAAMLVAGASTFSFYQGEELRVAVEPLTVATSAGIGLFLTLLVMGLSSHRASGFHIAQALRGEAATTRSGRRGALLFGVLALAAGGAATAFGLLEEDPWAAVLGPSALAFGLATISDRFLPRAFAGFVWLGWVIYIGASFFFLTDLEDWENLTFPLRGLLLVLGGALVLVRSGLPPRLAALIVRPLRHADPVADPAFAYVSRRPARTVLTVTMVGLVVLILVVLGTMFSMFSASVTDDKWSGYDVVGRSHRPLEGGSAAGSDAFAGATRVLVVDAVPGGIYEAMGDGSGFWSVAPDLLSTTPAVASAIVTDAGFLADGYADGRAALQAVTQDPSLVVVSDYLWVDNASEPRGGHDVRPGDVLTLTARDGTPYELEVIALLDTLGFGGFFLHPDVFHALGLDAGSRVFATAAADVEPTDLARAIESHYRAIGMDAMATAEPIQAQQEDARTQLMLLQAFVGMGLLVGTASTGIVTARNVFERRREIGVMRAIGYGEGDIVRTFLMEAAYVVTVAAALGIAGGIITAYGMYQVEMKDWGLDFTVDYLNLALIAGVVYVTSLLAAWFPARRASRILPAEATRNTE